MQDYDLQVTPVDPCFEPVHGGADEIEYFYSGKSVLFALSDEAVKNKCQTFRLKICVVKPMPKDIKSDIKR